MQWLVRAGKLLLFVSGLVAVLDVLRKGTIAGWASSVAGQRDSAGSRRDSLDTVSPHLTAAARLAHWTADGSNPDVAAVRKRAYDELTADGTPAGLIDDARYTYPARERHAHALLASRLEPREAELLTAYLARFDTSAARISTAVGLVQVLAIPLALWAFWGDTVAMFIGWMGISTVAFMLGGLLLSPRVMRWIRRAGAVVSHRVASIVQWALDHEGRPLRAIALTLFILGSLVDLITGWD